MAERDVSPEEGDSVPFLGTLCGRDTLAGPRRPDLGASQKERGGWRCAHAPQVYHSGWAPQVYHSSWHQAVASVL